LSHAYFHKLRSCQDGVDFIIRRFGRLWPLHIFTLFLMVLWALVRIGHEVVSHGPINTIQLAQEPVRGTFSILAQVFLVHAAGLQVFFPGFDWNFPSWSISVEFNICIIFAVVSVVAASRKDLVLVGICALSALAVIILNLNTEVAIFRGLYGFLVGHFVYRLYARMSIAIRTPNVLEIVILVIAAWFVTVALVNNISMLVAPLVFGPTVYVFAQERGVLSSILKLPAVKKLGEWSYSIYLIHIPILTGIDVVAWRCGVALKLLNQQGSTDTISIFSFSSVWYGDVVTCLYLAVVIGVSGLTYRYIETPSRRFFYRLAYKRSSSNNSR
jgi:peptidoglycan/LPS O-acetylase OafA/YrhL